MSKPGAEVGGVVLAAGRGTRFAGDVPKQLLDWDGEPLVRRAVRVALASRLAQVVVAVGHGSAAVRGALVGLDVSVVVNPAWEEGQATSVRAGLERLNPECAAAVFLPADQPFLTADLVDRLIAAWTSSGSQVVVPVTSEGRRGAPVLWDRNLFPRLARLEGDQGGRQILAGGGVTVREVEVEDALELDDVDTAEDYRRLLEALRSAQRRRNSTLGANVSGPSNV